MIRPRLPTALALLTLLGVAMTPAAAWAQDGRLDVADGGDTAWLLGAALLGLLVLPGMALFQAGRLRGRNAVSILIQGGAVAALASILWVLVAYTLAFGDVGGGWIGKGNAWMLIAIGNVRNGTGVPESAFALFEMIFAMLAPVLMIGAWAERARFGWVVLFAALWSLVVYAPVAHWVWGGGWLASSVGMLDWAGGLVLGTTTGVSALVGAIMLGRRKGAVQPVESRHSPLLALLGAGLLWIGWLALSGGSALAATDDAAAAIIATHIAAASCALAWILIERLTGGKPGAVSLATGAVAGLATIAPAAGFVSPGAAIVFGIVGAVACRFAVRIMRRRTTIDDALDVFAIHGIGGMTGCLLLAPFLSGTLGGTGYAGAMNPVAQIVAQGIGVGVVAIWSAVGTAILALMASLAFPMRVSEDAEREGLDISSHGERAWKFD